MGFKLTSDGYPMSRNQTCKPLCGSSKQERSNIYKYVAKVAVTRSKSYNCQ